MRKNNITKEKKKELLNKIRQQFAKLGPSLLSSAF
jgi:hypothetical protein